MTEPDEQWEEGIETICDGCGERQICMCLKDPFLEEIHPDSPNEPRYWCRPCYRERLYEI